MRLEWCVLLLLLLMGVKPTKLTTTPKPSKRLPLQERHTNAFQERHASSHRTRHASSLLDRHVEYQSMYPEIKRLQAQTDDTEKLLHSEIQDFKFQLHELKESFNKQLHAQEQYFKLKLHGQEENFKRMLRRKTKGIHRKTEKLSTKGMLIVQLYMHCVNTIQRACLLYNFTWMSWPLYKCRVYCTCTTLYALREHYIQRSCVLYKFV